MIGYAVTFGLKAGVSRVGIESDCANFLAWCSFGVLILREWEVAHIIHDLSSLLRNVDDVFNLV